MIGYQAGKTVDGMLQSCGREHVVLHELIRETRELVHVGNEFDRDKKLLRHCADRVWRSYLAGKTLLKRSRLSGDLLMHWVGHVVHVSLLSHHNLSALWVVYAYINECQGRRCRLAHSPWGNQSYLGPRVCH